MPIFASLSSSSRTAGFFKPPASTSVRGRLYMWGANYYGTGNGTAAVSFAGSTINTPSTDLTWSSMAVGSLGSQAGDTDFSLFVKTNGTLWAVGYNGYGFFGDGTTTTRTTLTQVGSATNWAKVAAGGYHSMAIKTDGTLWATGYNNNGGLGLGDNTSRTTWTQVGSASNWSEISCGFLYTIALRTDGTLWATGYNYNGQLGLGDTTQRTSFTQVGSSTWSKIAAGVNSSMGVLTTGGTYGWGNYPGMGQCSGSFYSPIVMTPNMVDISLGEAHAIGVTTTGTIRTWGSTNSYGQLGYGNFSVNCPASSVLGNQVGSSTNWSQVSATYQSTFAINTNGDIYSWGLNNHPNYYLGQPQYSTDCYYVDFVKQLGFSNTYQYTYTESGNSWECVYSGNCDFDPYTGIPICCDPGESPQLVPYSNSYNCYTGRFPSPTLLISGTGNKFLALAKGYSSNHMAAIRTS